MTNSIIFFEATKVFLYCKLSEATKYSPILKFYLYIICFKETRFYCIGLYLVAEIL